MIHPRLHSGLPAFLLVAVSLAWAAAGSPVEASPETRDESTPNFLIVTHEAVWLSLPMMIAYIDAKQIYSFDDEGQRPWSVEARSTASIVAEFGGDVREALESFIESRHATCSGELFVLLLGDASDGVQPAYDHIPFEYYEAPHISGSELGWGNFVPTDWGYADVDDDDRADVLVGRVAVHDANDVESWAAAAVNKIWDEQFIRRSGTETRVGVRSSRSPDGIERFPLLYGQWREWSAGADRWEEQAGNSSYQSVVDIVVDVAEREGRPGSRCQQDAFDVLPIWGSGLWQSRYLDNTGFLYEYPRMEEEMDAIQNQGQQVLVVMGPLANKLDLVEYHKLQFGWDTSHLAPNYAYTFLVAGSCALFAIDREDGESGRPYVEQVHLLEDRGFFGGMGPTRQMRQNQHALYVSELSQNIVEATAPGSGGRSIGRIWKETVNRLLEEEPAFVDEWRSLLLYGDPTARIVAPLDVPVGIEIGGSRELELRLYPNPLAGEATIALDLPTSASVELGIFDVRGRRVRELVSPTLFHAGTHRLVWDRTDDSGQPVPSGIYFCRVAAGGRTDWVRAVLLQ